MAAYILCVLKGTVEVAEVMRMHGEMRLHLGERVKGSIVYVSGNIDVGDVLCQLCSHFQATVPRKRGERIEFCLFAISVVYIDGMTRQPTFANTFSSRPGVPSNRPDPYRLLRSTAHLP